MDFGIGVLLFPGMQPLAVSYSQRAESGKAKALGLGFDARQAVCGESRHRTGRQAFPRDLLRGKAPAADAGQRRTGNIRPPVVANKKDLFCLRLRFLQKQAEQLAAALLHAVIGRDEAAIKKVVAALGQHGVQLDLGQVHVGNIVKPFALGMQGAGGFQHRQVGHSAGDLSGAFCRRVVSGQAGAGINFRQRHFPAFGGTGFGLDAGFGEVRAQQGEQVDGAGHIALNERIKHIKGHHRVQRSLVQDRFSQFHGR